MGQRGQTQIQTADCDEANRRGRKRERPSSEVVVDTRWALKQKLAAVSQDIELLTQEVKQHALPLL